MVKKVLVDRHLRESFELATKLPLRDFRDEEDLEKLYTRMSETDCNPGVFRSV